MSQKRNPPLSSQLIKSYYDNLYSINKRCESNDSKKRVEADRVALEWIARKSPGKCLNIGAGNCPLHRSAIKDSGLRLVEIDISFSALFTSDSQSNINADGQALPFKDNSFDAVTLFSVLMFMDPARVLSEVDRILKPGGRIAVVEPLSGNPFWRIYRTLRREYSGLAHYRSWKDLLSWKRDWFPDAQVYSFYLTPLSPLLYPTNRLRKLVFSLERATFSLIPLLSNFAWIGILLYEKRSRI